MDISSTLRVATSCLPVPNISNIVPMVAHPDHSEHSVDVLVTDQGIADLTQFYENLAIRRKEFLELYALAVFRRGGFLNPGGLALKDGNNKAYGNFRSDDYFHDEQDDYDMMDDF